MINSPNIEMILRIPGNWDHPDQVLEQLPDGYSIDDRGLHTPAGNCLICYPVPRDDQFASVFLMSNRSCMTDDEIEQLQNYQANMILAGYAGTQESALEIMQAGSAICQAGALGVFIDNSGVSHTAEEWIEMTEDQHADAISYALIGVVAKGSQVQTMGMQLVGLPDILMPFEDATEDDGQGIAKAICHFFRIPQTARPGEIVVGSQGPQFRVATADPDDMPARSPMHNPFGRIQLDPIPDNLSDFN